mmetsp:Transcript_12422/g.26431  ORF Transcript_12422/g.26431 Transcript_12422/m.26431 type:complete len:231 (-) Transcript_12422:340-1032(-)
MDNIQDNRQGPAALPNAKRAKKIPPKAFPAISDELGSPIFPQLRGYTGHPARGPWSFHEHRLFEQGCIMYGWGSWKKIAEAIPGRTRDQCKSHGQKYGHGHPNEKARLIAENKKMISMLQEKSEKNKKPRSVPKKASSKKLILPTQANRAFQKKEKQNIYVERAPTALEKKPPAEIGGGMSAKACDEIFNADSIDTICNEIYERKQKGGCPRFPLCTCEQNPCVRKDFAD